MRLSLPLPLAIVFCCAILAEGQYSPATYTTLEPPNSVSSVAYGISTNGTIVGEFQLKGSQFGRFHSFTVSPAGAYTIFDIPFGFSTYATGVNNSASTVGGYSVETSGAEHEFARLANGKVEYYDPPRALITHTQFASINNLNHLSGDQTDSSGVTHGFVSDFLGTLALFDVPGASDTLGGVINDYGVAAGAYLVPTDRAYHAYIRDSAGNITAFDVPGAGTDAAEGTYVAGLNASSQISGAYADSNHHWRGFLRESDETITTFDAPDAGSGSNLGTFGSGINDAGQIAGYYYDSQSVAHGFIRDTDGTVVEFDDPSAGTQSGQGTFAFGISNTGVVAGLYYDSSGYFHAYKRQ